MRNKLFLTIAASLMSASLYADCATFVTMDTNDDGKITKDEYHGTIADVGIYSDLDLDDDGYLTDDEFYETDFDDGLYDDWDVNDDDLLDDDEFYDGAFTYYDENEDAHWNNGEWDDAGDAGFWDL